jgi:hypothetical protein
MRSSGKAPYLPSGQLQRAPAARRRDQEGMDEPNFQSWYPDVSQQIADGNPVPTADDPSSGSATMQVKPSASPARLRPPFEAVEEGESSNSNSKIE